MTVSANIICDDVISEIRSLIKLKKEENGIKNEIIRDDIFSLLQAMDCIVLYYPLEEEENDGCDACHIEKPLNGKMEHFIFINTINTRERQAFSAAHELGHIWKIDEEIKKKFPGEKFDTEEIINRFAAELLMPEELFKVEMYKKLEEFNYNGKTIGELDLIKLTAHLMDFFFVPFKSVIYRFVEIKRIDDKISNYMLKHKDSNTLKEIIKAEQYTRLGIVNKLRSIDKLHEYLHIVEKENLYNKTIIENIKKDFDIENVEASTDENISFGEVKYGN